MENNEEEKLISEETSTPNRRKGNKKSYEVILVSESYIVYKHDNGSNAWIPRPEGKEIKVGDRIKL